MGEDDNKKKNKNGNKNGTSTTSSKGQKASSLNKKKVAMAVAAAAAKKSTISTDVEPFTSRDIPAAVEAKRLPQYPWDSLTLPSERADDIVRFVEEAISMKIPEPPRPAGEYDTSDGGIDMGIND